MKNMRVGAFLGLIVLLVSVKPLFANVRLVQLLRDIPLPQGASIQWVSDDVSHNGTELIIAHYDSPLSHQETIDFYQGVWPTDKNSTMPGLIKTEIENWLLISRFRENINTVLQLDSTNSDRSTGFLSSVDINSRVSVLTSADIFSGIELISHTSSNDEKTKSLLSVYQSGHSPESLIELMMGKFQDDGWQILDLRSLNESKVVSFRRSDLGKFRRLEMVVSKSATGGSLAVVNEVTYDG